MKKVFYLLAFLFISYGAQSQIVSDTAKIAVLQGATTNFNSSITITKHVRVSDSLDAKVYIINDTAQLTSVNGYLLIQANGFVLPRLTTVQRLALTNTPIGNAVFDTDIIRPLFYDGANWIVY